ncbi:MAG: hypothetical protein WCA84_14790 [Ignavibacteriaceae bacterium]
MWVLLKIDEIESLFDKGFLLLNKYSKKIKTFPDKELIDGEVWIRLSSRYKTLGKEFQGPVFVSHIEEYLPISDSAYTYLSQLSNMFDELKIYIGLFNA